ncbi:MAG: nucleotidyltransferase [Planctomycetes bacterium]|nr:nucleotidyltransferase [Planctomycetota bacterium]
MLPIDPTPQALADALDVLVQVLNEKQTAYAVIGGIAASIRGQIRPTRDIDLLIQVPQLSLPGVLDSLVARGFILDVAQTIQIWNTEHLVNFSRDSIRIDWLKPLLPAFERILDRARWEQIGDRPIRVADAEGLLLLKLIAFRVRDQEDIKGILAANAGKLDLSIGFARNGSNWSAPPSRRPRNSRR